MNASQETTLHGIAASPGIIMGPVYVMEDDALVVTQRKIEASKIPSEIRRYKRAIERTHVDLNAAEVNVLKALGKQHARLIEAHRLILDDPILTKDVPRLIESQGVNTEFALSEILSRANHAFEALADEFFRERRHDLFDVGRRVLRHLARTRRKKDVEQVAIEASIVVAKNLLPSDTLQIKDRKALGFATEMGSRLSHVAILAQSLEIPAIVGVPDLLKHVASGDEVIIDGDEGVIHLRPSVATTKQFRDKQARLKKEEQDLLVYVSQAAVTADGLEVALGANLDTLDEIPLVSKYGAVGIGLFRTELVVMAGGKTLLMDAEAQTEIYRETFQKLAPHPVVIRLLDIGSDKLMDLGLRENSSSGSRSGVSTSLGPPEENLPMGLRGIRLLLRYPKILRQQLRAILAASPAGDPKILLPMVSAIEEVREVKWLIAEIAQELSQEGVAFKEKIPLGIMVEVPSVAIQAEAFLDEVDFVSVGTNDLVQYTLACDRMSAELAYLYQEFHPAVLKLLAHVAEAARQKGRWVGICGELVNNPLALPLLIGMGFNGLSTNPRLVPKIKRQLRGINAARSRALVDEVLGFGSYEEVVERVKREFAG
ncbi:MAG: phosphoenolpyruvate--protein phosphotransferase [Elusimicrobia bacterium]|nr:phosphoenolpyruvate--protein phosphotransferase [Elusimicrobiota bacterium]